MDVEAATMHALRRLSSHPYIATAAAVSAAVQSPKDKSGRTGRGWVLLPLKGESWVTPWGTRLGERGGGVGLAMVNFLLFFDVPALFLCQRLSPERKKKDRTKKKSILLGVYRLR
jgi:hypothetical protein